MSCDDILAELDEQQRIAATITTNAVVSAGAGSGKTKVLAARYAWLIMEKGYHVDEILTLTFTKKAVSEMYSRIYQQLAGQENIYAQQAVSEFYRARIFTIDSFCAGIVRSAARLYGITPDFRIDDEQAREIAFEMALPFILEHRRNPALQLLMVDRKIKTVAHELFAQTILQHTSIAQGKAFNESLKLQGEEIVKQWDKKTQKAKELIDLMKQEMFNVTKRTSVVFTNLEKALTNIEEAPEIRGILEVNGFLEKTNISFEYDETIICQQVNTYLKFLYHIKSVAFSGKISSEMAIIRECHKTLKNHLYDELESIAQFAFQSGIIASIFPLLDEFQQQFNYKKREAGILTFQDIAHLAVDALSRFPEIRQSQKESIKAIMIDEFQDNNALQRDLLFLLAERPERCEQGIPSTEELCNDRMFFVGDEKQSIYRFRGADVSVFRTLSRTLVGEQTYNDKANSSKEINATGLHLNLIRNYRSKPALIAAFNSIFGSINQTSQSLIQSVFLKEDTKLPDFEATYSEVFSPFEIDCNDINHPPVHFCFLDKDNIQTESDAHSLSVDEIEIAFVASRIKDMVDSGYTIQERSKNGISSRPCCYGDFTILLRTLTKQNLYEKQLRNFEIPYNVDNPTGLFQDAPVNDIYNLLRLIVYPRDSNAYAAVIRSPFIRLSDLSLTICLLNTTGIPFDENIEQDIPLEERDVYKQARQLYTSLVEFSQTSSIAEVITYLWYTQGYRFETLWSGTSQIYTELYDYFFELARQADIRGKTLADFLDYISNLIEKKEKIGNLDIPIEREQGVRIMSIHKSKGLEFPIVFVCGCGSSGRKNINIAPFYYSKQWGLTLNIQAVKLPGDISRESANYFFNMQKEEEHQKEIAELRRLLYVAMTRAESTLFVTGSLPLRTKDEKEEKPIEDSDEDTCNNSSNIEFRLRQLALKIHEKNNISTFCDLLIPAIAFCEEQLFTIEEIPIIDREQLHNQYTKPHGISMKQTVQQAINFYNSVEILTTPEPIITTLPASSVQNPTKYNFSQQEYNSQTPVSVNQSEFSFFNTNEIDTLLETVGLDAADFGTIVHSYLQARFDGSKPHANKPHIPLRIYAKLDDDSLKNILEATQSMTDQFFASRLGQLSLKAKYCQSEFPFISLVSLPHKNITISGQIDLIFESSQTMHIIDFKTDSIEDKNKHLGQLAVYNRAISDIFHKPVKSYLFFLRNGTEQEVTQDIQNVNIEEIVKTLV